MHKNMRAALLATTVSLSGAADAAANVVLDPGFESGAFGTWVSGGGAFTSISGVSVNSGSFAYRNGCVGAGCVVVGPTGVSGLGTITQTIDLQPGIYQGTFFYHASGGTPNRLAVSLGNHTPIDLVDTAAAPYTQYSFISAASGGLTNLVFGMQNNPLFDHIDDVSLVQIDDIEGPNNAAAAQTVAVQASRDLLDRLQDRFNHAGSPIQSASVRETVVAAAGNHRRYEQPGGRLGVAVLLDRGDVQPDERCQQDPGSLPVPAKLDAAEPLIGADVAGNPRSENVCPREVVVTRTIPAEHVDIERHG